MKKILNFLPNPKWSLIIALISATIFCAFAMILITNSHNYCNYFCQDLMCDANDSCHKLDILKLIKIPATYVVLIGGGIFIPCYLFQIIDKQIHKK